MRLALLDVKDDDLILDLDERLELDSASQGHIVPTSLVHDDDDGGFLFGNLGLAEPSSQVPEGVWRLTSGGSISLVADGLTAVTGATVHHGRIYALEAFTASRRR